MKLIQDIKQALRQLAHNGVPTKNIFDALRETEIKVADYDNEMILKHLIKHFKNKTKEKWNGIAVVDIVKCLENQAEKKHIKAEPLFMVGDTMRTLEEAKHNWTDGMPVVVSIDDEYYYCNNETIRIIDQYDYEYPPMNRRQQPVWSEDDEKMLNSIIEDFGDGKTSNMLQEYFLKSLKSRVQPQPKQEWSKDDEDMLYKVTAVLNRLCAEGKECVWSISTLKKLFYWLKDLKSRAQSQNTWKPSEEHINWLIWVINRIPNTDKANEAEAVLRDLLEQLNKLREE